MGMKWWGLGAGVRFFVTLAAISLIPVIALGAVLGQVYGHELRDRGISQGQLQAALISRVITDTELEHEDLLSGVTLDERTRLDRLADTEVDGGIITRFRLRSPNLHVVYSSDGSGVRFGPADQDGTDLDKSAAANVVSALNGDSVAVITERSGAQVIEAFAPLHNFRTHALIGVLQIDLPYAPIAAQMTQGLHRLYFALAGGLIALYLILGSLVWWATGELARSAAHFEHQALHDALTDLPNRALFGDRITQTATMIERGGGIHLGPGRRGGGAAVVLIDLNGFREINDSMGQANGNLLLTTIAERLRRTVRAVDTVAGLGGDRFGLILAGVERQDQIEAALSRIKVAIEAEVMLDDLPVKATASLGVSFLPKHGNTPDVLLQKADVALDVAKRTHGELACYDDEQNHYSPDRLALISQLRQAVANNELVLHYQPKVRQPDGHVHCFEALVRWQHPSRGLLSPDEFVPLAEQTGLIDDLTRWVLNAALTQLKQWRISRPDLTVAVNISARSLRHVDLPQMVLDAMTATGSEPSSLLLEISETALQADPEHAALVMTHLSGVGLRLSLDDFGLGYTSLSQLAALPLNELKIDRSFVMNMLLNPGDAAIVRSVIDMGHNLGLDVVAEGVETPEVLYALTQLDCDVTQGFYFSKPLPAEQIVAWLAMNPINR
jgi:diguanylate cyclase (GGDEF)-like protein